ncbi:MAG TPA: DUF1048 domain-containing protein [Coriobacteriia bacterium]|nr:DUF1048 domain-containing protein [Coriobacteriia bacterium]
MAAAWIEAVTGSLEQKKQYREYKARAKALPASYSDAFSAIERYLMYAGGIAKGDVLVRMYGDLVDLFETSAADETPIRDVVSDDPVEFVETFVANYADGSWIKKERDRLVASIERAEAEQAKR